MNLGLPHCFFSSKFTLGAFKWKWIVVFHMFLQFIQHNHKTHNDLVQDHEYSENELSSIWYFQIKFFAGIL